MKHFFLIAIICVANIGNTNGQNTARFKGTKAKNDISFGKECAQCGITRDATKDKFYCLSPAEADQCGADATKLDCCADKDCCRNKQLEAVKALSVGYTECKEKEKVQQPCLVGSYLAENKAQVQYEYKCNQCSINKDEHMWGCIKDADTDKCRDFTLIQYGNRLQFLSNFV